jgi:hypothetical protein
MQQGTVQPGHTGRLHAAILAVKHCVLYCCHGEQVETSKANRSQQEQCADVYVLSLVAKPSHLPVQALRVRRGIRISSEAFDLSKHHHSQALPQTLLLGI